MKTNRATVIVPAAAALLGLAAAGAADKGGGGGGIAAYTTSGAKLEAVLIGTPAGKDEKDRTIGKEEGLPGAQQLNIVIDSPYQVWNEMGSYIHLAAFDQEFKPAAKARVYVDGKAAGRTDENGTFVFASEPLPAGSGGGARTVEVVYEKGAKKHYGQVSFNSFPRTESFASAHVFVSTDRGLYNPGQAVRIRVIAWSLKDDFAPLAGKTVELLFKNAKGQVVAGGGVETDAWGIAAMEIPLPDNAPEGSYRLEAAYAQESASADLRIERFVPPVIEIAHTLGRYLVKGSQSLSFDVTLGLFGGGAFEKGSVKVSVVAGGRVVHEVEKKVAGAGPHPFALDAKAMEAIAKECVEDDVVKVKLAAKDQHGRKDAVTRDLRWTSNPWVVVVELDKDQYAEGETAHVVLRAADLDKVPLRDAALTVEAAGAKYAAKTDGAGVAKLDLAVPGSSLAASVFVPGVAFPVATFTVPWTEPRPMSSEIPEGSAAQGKETDIVVRFPMGFVPVEKVVHADIVDISGALIGSLLVPVKKEGGAHVAKGKVRAPSWGSMLLTLFCLGRKGDEPVGLLTDGQNLAVLPGKELEVTMEGVPAAAAPGSAIEVSATVKDAAGAKTAAAVGASIVDQAVLSLLDPLEKTPMDRFYNPQLKVMSTAGSKILTWPVVTRTWGSPTYDIALPPFGFRAGGATMGQLSDSYGAAYGLSGMGMGGGGAGDAPSPAEPAPPPAPPATTKSYSPQKNIDYDFADDTIAGEMTKPDVSIPPAYGAAAPSATEGKKYSMAGKEQGPSKDARTDGGAAPPVITVRTNFAETSLWEPLLVAKGGKIVFSARLPDSITTQTVTLIASDDKGGVGMARAKIGVTQDVYARGDVPATLTLGDSIEVAATVRNLTAKAVACALSLRAQGLAVTGPADAKVEVPAGGMAAAVFTLSPQKAGKASYEVEAKGSGFVDVEKRELFVRPAGLPDRLESKGFVKKDKPFKAKINVSGKDAYLTAFLGVSFPTMVPAIQGMEAILAQPGGAIDVVASKALTAAMVYRYLAATTKDEAALERLRPFLQQLMAALLMTQEEDGGWGWHFNLLRASVEGKEDVVKKTSNPYMTAQAVEGLVEMKRAGLPIPEAAVGRAMQWLAQAAAPDGRWSVDDIAFWEGKTEKVREGIGAEIFRVMAEACEEFPALRTTWKMGDALGPVYEANRKYVYRDDVQDPMALANAALGVRAWAKLAGTADKGLDARLAQVAKKLIALRKEAYWEPSWFNAFGGTIEASAAAMAFLAELDREKYEAELRGCLQHVLSTQGSFGAWHNARGTAAAVRALLVLPPTGKEVPSTVSVLVNGKVAAKADIDPADPWLSAVALRQVELTGHLAAGENVVEVVYDGALKAPVKIALEKWGAKKGAASAPEGAPQVSVSRSGGGGAKAGGPPVEVKLSLDVAGSPGPLVVTEPIPSNGEVEGASLEKLVADGTVEGYELEGGSVVFHVDPKGKESVTLAYRLGGTRKGTAVHGGASAASVAAPALAAWGPSTTFEVK